MQLDTGQKKPIRFWPLALMLILCALLGAWHNRSVRSGRTDLLTSEIQSTLAPPASFSTSLSHWFGNNLNWIFRGHTLAAENRRLKQQVAELRGQNAALQEEAIQNLQLKQDLGFVQHLAVKPIAARVIGYDPDPDFDTLLLSQGSSSGIHAHSVVVTRNGLVGQVSEVTPSAAVVVLLTDRNGMAGGRVQRASSRAVGICQGNYTSLLSLIDLPDDADVRPGDKIVTSGYGIFPPGIPIGTVLRIQMDPGDVSKRAIVRPAVDFNQLEEVYVLR